MSGQDPYFEMRERRDKLDISLEQLEARGISKAEAEMNYRIKRREETLRLRDAGTSVTLIQDLCRGEPEVAKLKFEWDVATTMEEVAKESINVQKQHIGALREQIEREWRG